MAISGHASNSGTTGTLSPTLGLGFTASAGDLLVAFVGSDAAITGHTYGGSWVELDEQTYSGGRGSVGYLIASGGETAISVTGSGTADRWEAVIIRIPAGEWHGTTAPEIATSTTGTSTAPDSGSLSPSWGSETDNIWISGCVRDDSTANTVSAYPTNYGTAQTDSAATTSSANVGAAVRLNTTATEDPGAFTISASEAWRAWTVGVRPAGAAAPAPDYRNSQQVQLLAQ